jgi:hypothetical protein
MKWVLTFLLPALALLSGCASKAPATPETAPAPAAAKLEGGAKLLVTPDDTLIGRVATYNAAGRFVVLDFPAGHLPLLEQTLFVYRQGVKVGELKVTGPQRDNNTVADLVSGEAQKGDEIRDR